MSQEKIVFKVLSNKSPKTETQRFKRLKDDSLRQCFENYDFKYLEKVPANSSEIRFYFSSNIDRDYDGSVFRLPKDNQEQAFKELYEASLVIVQDLPPAFTKRDFWWYINHINICYNEEEAILVLPLQTLVCDKFSRMTIFTGHGHFRSQMYLYDYDLEPLKSYSGIWFDRLKDYGFVEEFFEVLKKDRNSLANDVLGIRAYAYGQPILAWDHSDELFNLVKKEVLENWESNIEIREDGYALPYYFALNMPNKATLWLNNQIKRKNKNDVNAEISYLRNLLTEVHNECANIPEEIVLLRILSEHCVRRTERNSIAPLTVYKDQEVGYWYTIPIRHLHEEDYLLSWDEEYSSPLKEFAKIFCRKWNTNLTYIDLKDRSNKLQGLLWEVLRNSLERLMCTTYSKYNKGFSTFKACKRLLGFKPHHPAAKEYLDQYYMNLGIQPLLPMTKLKSKS